MFNGSVLLLLVLTSRLVSAAPQEQTFTVETRLVQIEARVTQGGKPLLGLTIDDFQLKDRGQLQEIVYFDYVPPLRSPSLQEEGRGGHNPAVQPEPAEPAEAAVTPTQTWIYIIPEIARVREFQRAAESLEVFFAKELPAGAKVSIGGLPFTENRTLLLETLRRMTERPYSDESGSIATAIAEHRHLSDLEFEREIAKSLLPDEDVAVKFATIDREPMFVGASDGVPLLSVETIDRQIQFYGQLAFLRYLELVERLASYPGKKIIVLFRSGLRLDVSDYDLVRKVSTLARRNRISFYTMDSRGLDGVIPVRDRRASLAWSGTRPNSVIPNVLERYDRHSEAEEGLEALAKETGGRSITDANDFSLVLKAVTNDSYDYYVLGYYPTDLSETGRFRKIRVEVNRPGAKIKVQKGYFEPRPFNHQSKRDRAAHLARALRGDLRNDLPVAAEFDLFADQEGYPLLVFSVGTALGTLSTRNRRNNHEIKASALLQLSDTVAQRLPIYHEHLLEHQLTARQWQKSSQDQTVYAAYNSQVSLPPGRYHCKLVFRDEESGKIGYLDAILQVPDFRRPSTPSTILLTRQVQSPLAGDHESNPLRENGSVYVPQPSNIFRRGETIHLLYHLYNPQPEDLKEAELGMQIALFNEGLPVNRVEATGQPSIDPDRRVIRYTAALGTRNLQPGRYRIRAVLPNPESRSTPHLEQAFTIVE